MRRSLLLTAPLALLSSACSLPAWLPANTPQDAWTQTPQLSSYTLRAKDDILRDWQLSPQDPWAAYAKYTLFTSLASMPRQVTLPDVASLDEVMWAQIAGRQIAANGLPPDTLWVVNLRGAASVAFGIALSQVAEEPVTLIPTFNNWPAKGEVIPPEETLAAVATMTPRPTDGGGAHPVFLLDAWRLAFRDDEVAENSYDNRYMLTPADLPDAETLRSRGIRRVIYVVPQDDDNVVEEDDLHTSFLDWDAAGISIAMVGVSRFLAPIEANRWDDVWVDDGFYVEPRVTFMATPHFYMRAHGGFGGRHALPSHPHWGGHGRHFGGRHGFGHGGGG